MMKTEDVINQLELLSRYASSAKEKAILANAIADITKYEITTMPHVDEAWLNSFKDANGKYSLAQATFNYHKLHSGMVTVSSSRRYISARIKEIQIHDILKHTIEGSEDV